MGVNDWSQAERDLYALGSRLLLDDMERTRQSMAAELDLYRDDWSTRHAEMTRAHNERMQRMRDDQAAWLDSFYDDGEPAPTQDPQDQARGASAAGSSSPAMPGGGPGPGQPINPHAVDLEESERIRDLTMAEYAAERQRLIRPNQGMF